MGSAFRRMDASMEDLLDEIARLREEGARLRQRLEQATPALASSMLAALTAPQPGVEVSAAMLPLVPEGMAQVLDAVAALVGADTARVVLLASPAAVWLPAGTPAQAIPEAAWERLQRGERWCPIRARWRHRALRAWRAWRVPARAPWRWCRWARCQAPRKPVSRCWAR